MYQVITIAIIVGVVGWLVHNTVVNMRIRGIQSGFDFLLGSAGFDIGESLIRARPIGVPTWWALSTPCALPS
jgi:general L-amino acid transport system permease protein